MTDAEKLKALGVTVKPLVWERADDLTIELGRCHGYDEMMAYIGDQKHLHWYRIYSVSDGKWRWAEQFRMVYIGGNTRKDIEPVSPATAKAAAQADYERRILSALTIAPNTARADALREALTDEEETKC